MKKFFTLVVISCLLSFTPFEVAAQVVATIITESLESSVTEAENDYNPTARISYKIKVRGAEGHTLRVEAPWLNGNNKQVYTNIDNNEKAVSTNRHKIEARYAIFEGSCSQRHDALWLPPGLQRLYATLRIYDETLGEYIPLTGTKKHTFTYTSTKKARGIKFTQAYLEHNQYVNGNKVMYVRYAVDVNWMKNKEIRPEVALFKANGTPVYFKEGKAAKLTTTITPKYTFTEYSSLYFWFSLSHINLPKGRTNCYALIRLYDAKTGTLLAKSQKLEFYITK